MLHYLRVVKYTVMVVAPCMSRGLVRMVMSIARALTFCANAAVAGQLSGFERAFSIRTDGFRGVVDL